MNFIMFSPLVLLRKGSEGSTVELSCPSITPLQGQNSLSNCSLFKNPYTLAIISSKQLPLNCPLLE